MLDILIPNIQSNKHIFPPYGAIYFFLSFFKWAILGYFGNGTTVIAHTSHHTPHIIDHIPHTKYHTLKTTHPTKIRSRKRGGKLIHILTFLGRLIQFSHITRVKIEHFQTYSQQFWIFCLFIHIYYFVHYIYEFNILPLLGQNILGKNN